MGFSGSWLLSEPEQHLVPNPRTELLARGLQSESLGDPDSRTLLGGVKRTIAGEVAACHGESNCSTLSAHPLSDVTVSVPPCVLRRCVMRSGITTSSMWSSPASLSSWMGRPMSPSLWLKIAHCTRPRLRRNWWSGLAGKVGPPHPAISGTPGLLGDQASGLALQALPIPWASAATSLAEPDCLFGSFRSEGGGDRECIRGSLSGSPWGCGFEAPTGL